MNNLEIPDIEVPENPDISKDVVCQECGSLMRRFFENGRFVWICGGCGATESE